MMKAGIFKVKKFFLCIIVSLMMIFTGATPAFAIDTYPEINGGTFIFKHFLIMNEMVYVPPIVFSCSITPVTGQGSIYPGPVGATINNVTYNSNSPTYNTHQGTDKVLLDENEKYARNDVLVDLTNAKFSAPGTYRYLIRGIKTGATDGITGSPDMYLDVYITHDTATTLKVASTFLHLTTVSEKVEAVSDHFITYDLRTLNYVIGNQGDKTKDFTYTLRIDGGTPNKKYLLRVSGEGPTGRQISSQETVTFTLKHGERARIHGLTENDKYTITQDSYLTDGYKTQYDINSGQKVNALTTDEKTMGAMTNTVTFYNDKNTEEPVTGIILNRLPYIIMIVLSAGFGGVFFYKKHAKLSNK